MFLTIASFKVILHYWNASLMFSNCQIQVFCIECLPSGEKGCRMKVCWPNVWKPNPYCTCLDFFQILIEDDLLFEVVEFGVNFEMANKLVKINLS